VIRRPVRLLLGLALSGTGASACTFTTVVPLHYAAPAGAARSAIDTPIILLGGLVDGFTGGCWRSRQFRSSRPSIPSRSRS